MALGELNRHQRPARGSEFFGSAFARQRHSNLQLDADGCGVHNAEPPGELLNRPNCVDGRMMRECLPPTATMNGR